MISRPEHVTSIKVCVERIFAHCGSALRVAAPLGLGKPNVLLNQIYARVAADPALQLHLYTALSLARPVPKSDLERRFLGPFLTRQFGVAYPDLQYVLAQHAGTLPANIRVQEFYLQSGAMLHVKSAQRDYVSMNYTLVARDLVDREINVVVQMIAAREDAGVIRYSLACNPDVTADLLDQIAAAGGERPFVVGVVHPDLPFIGNEALVDADFFDVLLFDQAARQTLFALPREPIDTVEHAIGLHASTLVRDGGTLQIGIGALSDALVNALLLRQRDNSQYQQTLDALRDANAPVAHDALTTRVGGIAPFALGLYGASEMIMDGFMHLAQAGILSRRVFNDIGIERALADDCIGTTLHEHAADALHGAGVLQDHIDASELERLVYFGILPQNTQLYGTLLRLPDGTSLPTELATPEARATWNRVLSGRSLRNGRYLRGAFYLGSTEFYAWLRGLEGAAFDGLSMTRVSDINQLYGGRELLDALQRRDARFFNTCMMATLLGAAVSDALEDGQVVSGVGGQYNFVAMAHALAGGRSVLLLRSTREHAGKRHSNILFNYGHTTIPRHLRDVYVTEYGSADLRGKSDEDCIKAMLAISDAQFQDGLADQAKAAGKLRSDFVIPTQWRTNSPAQLRIRLAPPEIARTLPAFPFGSDFTNEELKLIDALRFLQSVSSSLPRLVRFSLKSLFTKNQAPRNELLMQRMELDRPRGMKLRLIRRMLLRALAQTTSRESAEI